VTLVHFVANYSAFFAVGLEKLLMDDNTTALNQTNNAFQALCQTLSNVANSKNEL